MLKVLVCLAGLMGATETQAADAAASGGSDSTSRFRDPDDGWLDVGAFLDTAYGFVPVIAPITEPAVGYGAAGALVFIDRDLPAAGQRFVRPNIAAVGGLATENGTNGLFAGHLGTWLDDRLRTELAVADADVNLEFFGLGGDRASADDGLDYSVGARGAVAGGSYRLGAHPVWLGLRYAAVRTSVTLEDPGFDLPEADRDDLDLHLAGVTPSLTLDTRDNFFTPTRGWYLDLSALVFREDLGGDRDFDKFALTVMHFRPLGKALFLGVRGTGRSSSEGTPFYLRPFVSLRGVQALQYQGEQAAEIEAELRWQFHPRFSLVGFGGAGIARSEITDRDRDEAVGAGGAGFRYLLARTHGLHMGIDLAVGPDEPIVYVVFGTQWLRP